MSFLVSIESYLENEGKVISYGKKVQIFFL